MKNIGLPKDQSRKLETLIPLIYQNGLLTAKIEEELRMSPSQAIATAASLADLLDDVTLWTLVFHCSPKISTSRKTSEGMPVMPYHCSLCGQTVKNLSDVRFSFILMKSK